MSWYQRQGRDLPWRRTRDPYAILVSEVMLQQTQVATVVPYYNEWLRRFPDFAALAAAPENDVLHAWQGLGYYSRARNFHRTAKMVANDHGGKLPVKVNQLRALPGVGKYTAHALATFAFNRPVPIVEANTGRVLTRLFNVRLPIDSACGNQRVWQHATALVPARTASRHNSALMDLGALICTSRNPKCGACPVTEFCRATKPESLPIKRPRPNPKRLTERHSFIVRRNEVLLQQSTGRWRGMWILPPIKVNGSTRTNFGNLVHTSEFPFTHHHVTLRVFRKQQNKPTGHRQSWFTRDTLASIPIPSPHRRAIQALLH